MSLSQVLEYAILGLALVAAVVLAIFGKISSTDAVGIVTLVVGYAAGSVKASVAAAATVAALKVSGK